MDKLRGLCCLLLLAILAPAAAEAQSAFQVKDLNTTRSEGVLPRDRFYSGSGFAVLRNTAYFRASDGIHGVELWRSDGTQTGTRLAADICPGSCSSHPDGLTVSGGTLYFLADDGLHGQELWKSDGTQAGTVLVEELIPDTELFVYLKLLGDANGVLVFALSGFDRQELWRSDGTAEGTFLLADVETNEDQDFPLFLTSLDGKLFLLVEDMDHGREIWTTDGTPAGTGLLKDIAPGPTHGAGTSAAVAGGRVLFAGNGPQGFELWASDGTPAGTALLLDILPGPASSYPENFLGQSGWVYFSASNGSPWNYWRSNGTVGGTTQLVPPSSLPPPRHDLGAANGFYFYLEWGGDEAGWQLRTADGTGPEGLRKLQINEQQSGIAVDDRGGIEGPRAFFDLDGTLLFQGDDGSTGAELWKSDGTAAGTSLVKDLSLSDGGRDSRPGELTRVGDTVFFRSGAGSLSERLWKTDGTPEGTVLLREYEHFPHDFGIYAPRELTALGDLLLFSGGEDDVYDLMKSDGTPLETGTAPVVTDRNSRPFYVESIRSLGELAFFQAWTSSPDRFELWKSDGTDAGTASLGVVLPFQSLFGQLLEDASAVRSGTLLFAGLDSEHGEELWQSDGTEAGTFLVAETVAGPDSKRLGPFATAGPTVFFAAAGHDLWKNDAGGTALVRALPGTDTAGIRSLTAVGNRVYFSYDDGINGRELWVSDGTEAGTRMVEDLFPGPGSSHPRELQAQGSILVFTAFDGAHGVEPWRSDGTALGTRMLQDIAPGDLPSSPTEFTAAGPNLYFAANDGTTGFELWALPRTALLSTFADVPAGTWSWSFVEALAANGITKGCAPDLYCPGQAVTRAEAAVFLMRGLALTQPPPPPGSGINFEDVPPSHWAWNWITQFAAQGYTNGCAPNRYCPESPISRAELAVFLLRVKHGASYVPPPATGTRFQDVPANYWVASWIEQLAAEGITNGCAENLFCPGRTVTRAEMAAFLVRTFELAVP